MISQTCEMPEHWASYLINGDANGLDEGEATKIDAYLSKTYPGCSFIDCAQEGRFTWSYDLFDGGLSNCAGGSVLEYTYLKARS